MDTRPALKWFLLPLSVLLLAVALTVPPVQAQTPELPYDEAEAQAIDRMIMCPVCPAESIDQAQVPIARQMRQLVREKLAQGATRQEILDFFAATYGPDILASPPKTGVNLLAWVLPIAGVLAALAAGVVALRSMTAGRATATVASSATAEADAEPDLQPYLDAVDRQLDLSASPAVPNPPTEASDTGGSNVEPDWDNRPNHGEPAEEPRGEARREGGSGTNG